MDISWSSVLAVICVHTHFVFLVSAFFCSLTLWGFTVSLVQLASLLLCNLTALERTVICKYNCTSRWYSQVALCMSVYLSFKSHTGMQLRCVHYFLCTATVFYRKINLNKNHSTHSKFNILSSFI